MRITGNILDNIPTELLCNIFRVSIDSKPPRRDLCRLSLVCRRWRECVESSAVLWTHISTRDGPTHVRRALEKSKEALIDLHSPSNSEMTLETLLAEAGSHMARCRSLKAVISRAPSWERASGPLTTAQAPCLEILELSLICVGYGMSQNTVTLFGGAPAPSTLRHLSLDGIPVEVEPLSLSGLVSLSLEEIKAISTPQLLDILRGSPWLEDLTLRKNPRLVAIGTQASTMPPIELPNLVSLSFEWLDHGGTNSIICNIRVPNHRRVFIRGTIREASCLTTLLTPAITHILHTTVPTGDVSASVIRVEIDEDDEFIIRFRGIELSLLVDEEDRLQQALDWLVGGLGPEAAECPVHFMLDWSEMDPLRLAAVPQPLVVKRLSISDIWSLQGPLYDAMVQPPNPAPPGWLFAQTESLSVGLNQIDSDTQFISMLRSRYQGATAEGGTGLRCPMNLKSVELRGQLKTEGLVREIREILGEVDVFWAKE
ncbi:hypothetical protein FRC01_004537 [Tulasnella sp. 417]|nr:hypothetical protein FRC01_004537 [Tulasnella sp. 417]